MYVGLMFLFLFVLLFLLFFFCFFSLVAVVVTPLLLFPIFSCLVHRSSSFSRLSIRRHLAETGIIISLSISHIVIDHHHRVVFVFFIVFVFIVVVLILSHN